MANRVVTGDEAREAVMRGLRRLAEAVKSTLGPKGHNVLFVRPFGIAVTRDGVSVAKEIELEDPLEGAGARLLRMVAASADEEAGDGTTTAVVLAEAMVNEGTRLVAAGADRLQLEKGLRLAVDWAVENLRGQAVTVDPETEIGRELIRHAATVSMHGDEQMGALVAEAIEKVGAEGMITLEDSELGDSFIEHKSGFQWEQGWIHAGFVNDPASGACVLDEPLILLSDRQILAANTQVRNNKTNLINLLERVGGTNRPLLIVADKVDGEALTTLALNVQRGTLASCAVEPPGFGPSRKENLRDLAIAVGAEEVFSSDYGHDLSKWTVSKLGSCRRAVIFEKKIMLIEPGVGLIDAEGVRSDDARKVTAAVEERARQLQALRGATDDDYEKEQLTIRLGRLTDGAAAIHVGAPTGAEVRERKDRLQDAVFSARAAVREGILPGGGVALLKAAEHVKEQMRLKLGAGDETEAMGVRLVASALEAPARQIALNAGAAPDVVLNETRANLALNGANEGYGYNAATGVYEDLVDAGIVDPVKVTRVALEKAASIAGLLLTTEAVVCHIPTGGVQTPGSIQTSAR